MGRPPVIGAGARWRRAQRGRRGRWWGQWGCLWCRFRHWAAPRLSVGPVSVPHEPPRARYVRIMIGLGADLEDFVPLWRHKGTKSSRSAQKSDGAGREGPNPSPGDTRQCPGRCVVFAALVGRATIRPPHRQPLTQPIHRPRCVRRMRHHRAPVAITGGWPIRCLRCSRREGNHLRPAPIAAAPAIHGLRRPRWARHRPPTAPVVTRRAICRRRCRRHRVGRTFGQPLPEREVLPGADAVPRPPHGSPRSRWRKRVWKPLPRVALVERAGRAGSCGPLALAGPARSEAAGRNGE
ncbi:hypothetical protein F4561_001698 [Lipingzhangella halophila]|uniref:Uncharacterized protein n=1 Tax=Lipingzhangella halophila TaxID=1783352 RepID=A0A7W7RFT0_9ACTN|nr:hypothetical protein [Lipingzhangella halophila]